MGQFEWESSNTHVSYPFEQPGIAGLNDAFVDAVILDTEQGLRVRLSELNITAWSAGSIYGYFTYEDYNPFFEGEPTVEVQTYGQWASVSFYEGSKRIILLMNTEVALPISVNESYMFVARVSEADPSAITSVTITDGETDVTHVLTGDVELQAGYNISLQSTASVAGVRSGNSAVTISAIPGAGLGVYPNDCQPDGILRTINAAGPDALGRIVINAEDCYRCFIPTTGSLDPSTFDPTPASVQISNDCEQCCKCTDYENAYKALIRLHNKGRNSGLRLARTIDDFNGLRNAVSSDKNSREIPTMNLLLRPAPGYIMGVQVTLMNNSTRNYLYLNDEITPLVDIAVLTGTVIDATATVAETDYVIDSIGTTDFTLIGAEANQVGLEFTATGAGSGTGTVIEVGGAVSAATVVLRSGGRPASYLFNSRYGNPWVHVTREQVLKDPVDPTGGLATPMNLLVPEGIVVDKDYHIVHPTQYASAFFELYFPDAADGDAVYIKLMSQSLKPYTLIKAGKLIAPFDGTDT